MQFYGSTCTVHGNFLLYLCGGSIHAFCSKAGKLTPFSSLQCAKWNCKSVFALLHNVDILCCSGFHDRIEAQIPQQWTDGKWAWTYIKLSSSVSKAKHSVFVFWAEHFPFHVKWLKTEKQEYYLLSINAEAFFHYCYFSSVFITADPKVSSLKSLACFAHNLRD